jgi:hypothetical protein
MLVRFQFPDASEAWINPQYVTAVMRDMKILGVTNIIMSNGLIHQVKLGAKQTAERLGWNQPEPTSLVKSQRIKDQSS